LAQIPDDQQMDACLSIYSIRITSKRPVSELCRLARAAMLLCRIVWLLSIVGFQFGQRLKFVNDLRSLHKQDDRISDPASQDINAIAPARV
jgi:hypothetical protein